MKNVSFKRAMGWLALLTVLSFIAGSFLISAQPSQEQFQEFDEQLAGCTSIMVGRLASTDGSVMTAHSCDGIPYMAEYCTSSDTSRRSNE